MTSTPVILYATFTARSGNAEQVSELIRELAERVREEPGNVVFDVTRRADDENSFFVYEEYVDEAAFQQHIAAPYGRPFNDALQSLIVEPRSQLTFLRRV